MAFPTKPLRRNKGMAGAKSGTNGHPAAPVTIGDDHTNHEKFQFKQRTGGNSPDQNRQDVMNC